MYRNRDGVHIKTNEVKDKHGHRDQGDIEREAQQKKTTTEMHIRMAITIRIGIRMETRLMINKSNKMTDKPK